MVVVHDAIAIFCLSTDTKPTTGVSTNRLLVETDTFKIYRYNATSWDLIGSAAGGGGGGETNTASNLGSGQGVFKTKSGVDLQFRSLLATSTKIALANNTNDVGIDVTEANLTLGNLGGTLGVAKGGTGAATITGILKGNGTSAVTASNTLAGITLTTPIINGQIFGDVSKVTGDSPFTVAATNSIVRIDNSASTTNFILNLPTAASIVGTSYKIRRTDLLSSTNITIVTPNGSETIGGCATWRLFPAEYVEIESDGTNWQVLDRSAPSLNGYYYLKDATADRRFVAGVSYQGAAGLVATTTAPALDTLFAFPLEVSRTTAFDTISFKITTLAGAGGVARAGIYYDTGNCYPGVLRFDTGSIAVDAGSTTTGRNTTITSGLQTFQPGLYWLAIVYGVAAPQVASISNANGLFSPIGITAGFSISTIGGYGYSVAHPFAALPNPYTASGIILNTTPSSTVPAPAIGLRPI